MFTIDKPEGSGEHTYSQQEETEFGGFLCENKATAVVFRQLSRLLQLISVCKQSRLFQNSF